MESKEKTEDVVLTPREKLILSKILEISASKNAGNETERVSSILKFLKGLR